MGKPHIIDSNKVTVPIVKAGPDSAELLGTAFFVSAANHILAITAKHIFINAPLKNGEKYTINLPPIKNTSKLPRPKGRGI